MAINDGPEWAESDGRVCGGRGTVGSVVIHSFDSPSRMLVGMMTRMRMGLRPGSIQRPKHEWSTGEGRRPSSRPSGAGRSSSAVDAGIPAPQNPSGKVGDPRPSLAPRPLTDPAREM